MTTQKNVSITLLTLALLAVAGVVDAQESESVGDSSRAPLADVADLEPAVDVGRLAPSGAQTSPEPAPAAGAARAGVETRVIDTLDLGTTSITGNQELPKVLYIVPWKQSDLGDVVGRPVNTLLDEVLAPVDPEVFERHLQFYESLYGTGQEE